MLSGEPPARRSTASEHSGVEVFFFLLLCRQSALKTTMKAVQLKFEVTPAGIFVRMKVTPHVCNHPGCGAAFPALSKLLIHQCIHSGEKPYACCHEGCSAKFADPANLTKHMRIHSGEKPYACSFTGCGAKFAVSSHLTRHMRIHSGEMPYACTFAGCESRFSDPSTLKKHLLVHSGLRQFACTHDGCSKAFARFDDLTKHLRTHTGERPYACSHEGCNSSFSDRSALAQHIMRIHSDKRPHACTLVGCNMTFATSFELKMHIEAHNGVKNFKCDYIGCKAAFTQAGALTQHKRRVHLQEKRFSCVFDGCGSSFYDKADLIKHERSHTGHKPYLCEYDGCDAKFTQSGSLVKHIKSVHTREWEARQKREEQLVASALAAAGMDFKREHQIDFSCLMDPTASYARIDFVIMQNGLIYFVEVDENQHKYGEYSVRCDMARMSRVTESLMLEGNCLPLVFVRYNPHAFKVDGEARDVPKAVREQKLIEFLNAANEECKASALNIMYMYYDTVDGVAAVTMDPEYHDAMRECCLPCIV